MRYLLVALASVPMTGSDKIRERRRRGHWLRLARVAAGVKQTDAAQRIGLKAGTSILALEKGRRDPTATEQRILAEMYGVPVSMFADPDPTDEERVMDARAALARAAIELAGEDRDRERGADQRDDRPPGEQPRTRSA